MIAILILHHPLRFVFFSFSVVVCILGGSSLLSNLILKQHFFEDPWKLCSDRRWSNRQDDDFTEEWVRSWCWFGGLGAVLGLGKRRSQGYCLCGSCAFWVEPKWWLYHLHDRSARALLQSRSHYQRRGRDRASTFPSLSVHLHGNFTLLTTWFLCGAFALRNFVFLFLFKGVWGCTSLREDGTRPENYAVAKWPLVSQNMKTYLQKKLLWCITCMNGVVYCRNGLGTCRNKHGVNFVAQMTAVNICQRLSILITAFPRSFAVLKCQLSMLTHSNRIPTVNEILER